MSQQTPTPSHRRTAAERAESNARIVAARAAGEPWKVIAARERISIKQARRGMERHLLDAASAPPETAPASLETTALVERALRAQLLALDTLEAKARLADNDSAQVGAAGRLSTVGVALIGLLNRLGRLGDLGEDQYSHRAHLLAKHLIQFVEEHGIEPEAVANSLIGLELLDIGVITWDEPREVAA